VPPSKLRELREKFHQDLRGDPLCFVPDSQKQGKQVVSNADEANTTSVLIAQAIADRIRNVPARDRRLAPQTAGDNFEKHVCSFVEATFKLLRHLRLESGKLGKYPDGTAWPLPKMSNTLTSR